MQEPSNSCFKILPTDYKDVKDVKGQAYLVLNYFQDIYILSALDSSFAYCKHMKVGWIANHANNSHSPNCFEEEKIFIILQVKLKFMITKVINKINNEQTN